MSSSALVGCATDGASRDEIAAMRRDMTQLAQRQAAMQQRIEEMDARLLVLTRRVVPKPDNAATGPSSSAAPAGIPVVKIGPTPAGLKAPPIPTQVALREPSPDEIDALESAGPKVASEEAADSGEFEAAVQVVSTGDIERGIAMLESFVKENPKHSKADNALLLAGVARIQSGDPAAAIPYLQKVLHDYPAGDAVPETLLRLSECHLKMKNTTSARASLAKLIADFPGTPLAKEAEARLTAMTPDPAGRQPRAARSYLSGH